MRGKVGVAVHTSKTRKLWHTYRVNMGFLNLEWGISKAQQAQRTVQKKRDEVEPKRDLLPPTMPKMESGMPSYSRPRGHGWFRKNLGCEMK